MKKTSSNIPAGTEPETPQRRAVYTKEFKLAAVARLKEKRQTATALALELGLRRNQLYKWANALEQNGAEGSFKPRGRKPASEESEVARLRRELASAQQEIAILKKFDAYLKQLKR